MTIRSLSTGAGEYDLADEQIFSDYEKELFSHVVELAEKEGKPVELLVVPAVNPFDAMVRSASTLQASRLVTGVSARMDSEELARSIGQAWQGLPEPRHSFSLEVISPDRPSIFVNLGPHPPRLWPEDVDLLHDIWLELSESPGIGLAPASSRYCGCRFAAAAKGLERRPALQCGGRSAERHPQKLAAFEAPWDRRSFFVACRLSAQKTGDKNRSPVPRECYAGFLPALLTALGGSTGGSGTGATLDRTSLNSAAFLRSFFEGGACSCR